MKNRSSMFAALLVAIAVFGIGITQAPAADACPRHDQMNLNDRVRDLRQAILGVEEKLSGKGGLIDQANLATDIPNTMPKQWIPVEPDSKAVDLLLSDVASQLQRVRKISAGRQYSSMTPNSVKQAFKRLDAHTLRAADLVTQIQLECQPNACRNALNESVFSLHREVRQMEKFSLDILEGTLGKSLGL